MCSYPWSRHSHVQLRADADADHLIYVSVQHLNWFGAESHRSAALVAKRKTDRITLGVPQNERRERIATSGPFVVPTCCWICHTMQVVSLEPEIRWMPQWSVDKQVTMSGRMGNKTIITTWVQKQTNDSRWIFFFSDKCCLNVFVFFTHVPDVLANSLSLHQRGDSEAVVPVATTEQQLAIMGDHKQCCRDLHARGKGFGQKTLGSAWKIRREEGTQKGELVRQLRRFLQVPNVLFSLGVGSCGVFDESKVVGDVLVVGKPTMGPNQAVLTNRHLERRVKPCIWSRTANDADTLPYQAFLLNQSINIIPQSPDLTIVSGLPCVMKEWDWFFGTTTLTSGTLSLMPCRITLSLLFSRNKKVQKCDRAGQTSTKNDLSSPRCSNMLRAHESSWALLFSTSSRVSLTGWGSCATKTHLSAYTSSGEDWLQAR